jgi:phosphatidylserine/phosphatidylglycerophosphate/cardiolipin synthase-like enzyme
LAAVLDDLKPLIAIIQAQDDSGTAASRLVQTVRGGDRQALFALLGDNALTRTALEQAGILGGKDILPGAEAVASVVQGAVSALSLPRSHWEATLTVPAFMRQAMPEGTVTETQPLLKHLVTSARSRVILASPFLDRGVQALIPSLSSFVETGGRLLLITRDLRSSGSANRKAVEALRAQVGNSNRLTVRSWEEKSLGIHLKALVADSRSAYVGSANFTWGGLTDHFEMGVHVTGEQVKELEAALEQLATELGRRTRLSSR